MHHTAQQQQQVWVLCTCYAISSSAIDTAADSSGASFWGFIPATTSQAAEGVDFDINTTLQPT